MTWSFVVGERASSVAHALMHEREALETLKARASVVRQ
jgi:hypothetical protein